VSSVTNMTNMFLNSGLSGANYDRLLVEWSRRAVQSGLTPNFGAATYRPGDPTIGRKRLAYAYSWTITDGGQAGGALWYQTRVLGTVPLGGGEVVFDVGVVS
jgi:hypothetical protein